MGQFFERLATAIVVLAALAVGGAAVRREFFPGAGGMISPPRSALTRTAVADWPALQRHGRWYADSIAPVTVVEFLDYECPFCARFHETLEETAAELKTPVALRLVQYPLSNHRFAIPAAVAAECAAQQGRFAGMTNVLFAQQDSFGLKSWSSLASAAAVKDTIAFARCLKTQSRAQINSDKAAGDREEVGGTPTVIVNGWRLSRPPSAEELKDLLTNPPRQGNAGTR